MAKAVKKKVTKKATVAKKVVPKKTVTPQVKKTVEPEKNNLTVDGTPYSPISMKKFSESEDFKHIKDKSLCVLIPGTNEQLGVAADDPTMINVLVEDRIMQAKWFIAEMYPKLSRVPAYLYRYIHYMMFSEEFDMKYPSDNDYLMALSSEILKETDEEYIKIHNFIKWGKDNSECIHLLGLVQLVGGTLKQLTKNNTGGRFYIEFPETGFHPKRERKIMSLLNKLKEEYGIKEDWTPTR